MIPKKKSPFMLTVSKSTLITPNMKRITFEGEGLKDFPENSQGNYVKLIFPQENSGIELRRTYTIRHHRKNEIDIDFVLHGDTGPASSWAMSANVGDSLKVGGPGKGTFADLGANWYLFAGDMTAIPAISVNLEKLHFSCQGHVVISVQSYADIQPLKSPGGFTFHWIVDTHPESDSHSILDFIKELPWGLGRQFVWVACEFREMRAIRRFLKQECGLEKKDYYVSSYWKYGSSEEQHRSFKKRDAESK